MNKTFQLWVDIFSWYDGDTFRGILDHGCSIYRGTARKPIRYRCAKINAPELHAEGGMNSRDYAMGLAPPGEYPVLSTGLDEYGRPLLDLILPTGYFSELMLAANQAIPYPPTST